jgi:hypothetical protein
MSVTTVSAQTHESEAIRPTPERLAKGGVVQVPADKRNRAAKPWQTFDRVIDEYAFGKRPIITQRQWEAGNRFWRLWMIAHGSDVAAQNLDGPITSSSTPEISEVKVAALQQLKQIAEVAPANTFSVLRAVCGQGQYASHWAASANMHHRSGLPSLRDALDWLAKRWKLPE